MIERANGGQTCKAGEVNGFSRATKSRVTLMLRLDDVCKANEAQPAHVRTVFKTAIVAGRVRLFA